MEISTSALPAVAAERATMFVALELSKSIWLVALHSPVADKVSQHRFAGDDSDGLLALIARKEAQAEARPGQTIRILSCYEAGYIGFWLHRLLCARGRQPRAGRREHPRRPAVAARQDRSA
jgi:transposase